MVETGGYANFKQARGVSKGPVLPIQKAKLTKLGEGYNFEKCNIFGSGPNGTEFWLGTSKKDKVTFICDTARETGAVNRSELRGFVPTPLGRFFTATPELNTELPPIFEENNTKREALLLAASKERGGKKYFNMHKKGASEQGTWEFWRTQREGNWENFVRYCKWLCTTLELRTITQFRSVAARTLVSQIAKDELKTLKERLPFGQTGEGIDYSKLTCEEMDAHRGTRSAEYWRLLHAKSEGKFLEYVEWAITRLAMKRERKSPTISAVRAFLPTTVTNIIMDQYAWEQFGLERQTNKGKPKPQGPVALPRSLPVSRFSSARRPSKTFSEANAEEREVFVLRFLRSASRTDMETLISYLDAGYPITSISSIGQTPMHILAEKKNPKFLAMLLSNGQFSEAQDGRKAQILRAKDNLGNTPVMVCAISGRPKSIALLANEGAPLNEGNNEGKTALILSVFAEENFTEAASALLEAGADPTLRDKGFTMAEYNADLEDGEDPITKNECTKIGKTYYVDLPRSAAEYARQLELDSLAKKLETSERKWKQAQRKK